MTLLQKLTEETQDRQLVAVRVLNAPRELVFIAWTSPGCLARWWGPKGFTNTFEIFEPVEGGQWKFTMHGPAGGHYANESRFVELSNDRIIIDHISKPKFHLIATFEDAGDERTRITFRQVFDTVDECDKVKNFAADANEENLDRLEEVLDYMKKQKKLLLIKTFDVAPEKLFDAWVKADLLKTWWGPRGFTNPVCSIDARPGGKLLIHTRSTDGMVFPTRGHFQKLERPHLLVFSSSAFEDENGVDQLENLNTISFHRKNGKTELQLQVLVLRSNATADEALDGMKEGWKQSLDKLENMLKLI